MRFWPDEFKKPSVAHPAIEMRCEMLLFTPSRISLDYPFNSCSTELAVLQSYIIVLLF
jgi:hypothetical protein